MKKYLVGIFSFICLFLAFSINVEAKSSVKENIEVSFGDEILNLNYTSVNSFEIESDKGFYFNAIKHYFNDDYTLVDESITVSSDDNSFVMDEETFTISSDKQTVTSSKSYEFYTLPVSLTFTDNETTYIFSQELCYKYDEVETCNSDIGDSKEVSSSTSYNFYYGFLPLYDENIHFDYLTYKFTLTSDSKTITFDDISFNKDEINYQDYFTMGVYNLNNNYLTTYNDKTYVLPFTYRNSTPYIYGYYMPGYISSVERNYTITFYVCVGEDYSECSVSFSSNNQVISSGIYYTIPLSGIIYDSTNITSNYSSFKLKGTYVCYSNCEEARAQNSETYANETIYYLNLASPKYTGEINAKEITCGYYYTCYGVNKINNKVSFSDDNGVEKIYYYLSSSQLATTSYDLINNEIANGDTLTIEADDGLYYLYFKVLDGSGSTNTYVEKYVFDNTAPYVSSDNFDSYDSDGIYNSVEITVSYSDAIFSGGAYKIYFKVIKESEYSSLTKSEVINNEEYSNGVEISDYISEDGLYRVCFVGMDYLDNYDELVCSNSYYLDITPLTKEEVVISDGNVNYLRSVDINISISVLESNVSFKCALIAISDDIVISSDLTSTCYNKQDNTLTSDGEGQYNLWIYASDTANNYALIKFDNIYLIDNASPQISYLVEGDNSSYRNDVKIKVSASDISEIASSFYEFYLLTYNESDFTSFNLEEEITYPYDYYGSYKLAIKVCDVLDNCKIVTSDESFLIDTGEIKIELIGKEKITILKWGKYKELGANASKGNNGKISEKLDYVISGNVNTLKVGVYYLEYSSGEGINKVTVIREVEVKDNTTYLIIFFSCLVLGEAIIAIRLFTKKKIK